MNDGNQAPSGNDLPPAQPVAQVRAELIWLGAQIASLVELRYTRPLTPAEEMQLTRWQGQRRALLGSLRQSLERAEATI
jgi:hypothetical protein